MTKMGKAPRAAKMPLRKGAWSPDEDQKLTAYINRFGIWNWNQISNPAGLARSGKSCRLRWMNYLRPDIKRGNFSKEEDETILKWHDMLGNRWSAIAAKLPGRTDNEIKNYWHSHLKKSIKNNLASNPEPHLVKASVVEVKRNELLRGVPEVSNLVGASGIQILPQQFPGDLSSSSTDLAVETHRNQTTEENFCSLKTFEELHSSWEQPFSFEDFRRNQKTEVTFASLKKFEEFQSLREQPLSSEVLYGNQMMEENFVSAKPFEEFQSFWEQPLPLVDLCMVETDRRIMGPTTALLLQEPIYPFIS